MNSRVTLKIMQYTLFLISTCLFIPSIQFLTFHNEAPWVCPRLSEPDMLWQNRLMFPASADIDIPCI